MNLRPVLLSAVFAPLSLFAQADAETKEEIRYQLILPDEKVPEQIKPTEHSPFTKQVEPQQNENVNSEHNMVMSKLMAMKASGIVNKDSDYSVLLGSLQLKRGEIVPPVIPNQSVQVKVNSITPEAIDFVWVDEKMSKRGLSAATFSIKLDMKPRITVILPGAASADGKTNSASLAPSNFVKPAQVEEKASKPVEKTTAQSENKEPKATKVMLLKEPAAKTSAVEKTVEPSIKRAEVPKASNNPTYTPPTPPAPPAEVTEVAKAEIVETPESSSPAGSAPAKAEATTATAEKTEEAPPSAANMVLDLFFKKPGQTK
jgi:hypothetical protein